MSKWRIIRLFNPLCYAGDVTSVEDLERHVKTNLDGLKRKLPVWSQSLSFDEDLRTIKKVIQDSKTVKYEDLPSLLVSLYQGSVNLRVNSDRRHSSQYSDMKELKNIVAMNDRTVPLTLRKLQTR